MLGRLDREGEQSVSDLAAKERVRPQSMAQTVSELERDRYVERRADPSDGRRALVSLTASGRATLEEDRRHREGWLAKAIDERLTSDERRVLVEATRILRRLVDD